MNKIKIIIILLKIKTIIKRKITTNTNNISKSN